VGAIFNDLHDVAQVLAEHIAEEVGIADVQAGTPRLVTATTEPAARITLLYTTPQPTHRNDPPERQPSGELRFAPLTLSCFYLITTSGADGDDPIAAHHALGRIMTLYHDVPILHLPLSGNAGSPPGAFTDLGDGDLNVVQVPMMLDQIDKIWTSLDPQLQPWALFDVAPVQLRSPLPDTGPAPAVLPGGIRLDVRAGTRPLITRITPDAVRPLGRVRIDALMQGDPDAVLTGGVEVPVAAGPPILLALDHGGLEDLGPGSYRLAIRARGLVSRHASLRIADPGMPVIDAPPGPHSAAADLVLAGANLAGATRALLWPDAGVNAPSDVHELPLGAVGATSVTVLAPATAEPGTYRLVVRIGARVYTPYVVLELTS
jgi:Pvc16 N-terminal domain